MRYRGNGARLPDKVAAGRNWPLLRVGGGRGLGLDLLRLVEEREPLIADCGEFQPVLFADGIGRRQTEAFEIFKLAFLRDPEVEMRAGGEAGHADQTDGIADFHALAGAHENTR